MKRVLLVILACMTVAISMGSAQFTPPENTISLGILGDGTRALDFNTFGSIIDTELGLFDANGVLLAQNDDINGTLQSQIVTPLGLPNGTYYLAAGQFETIFEDGFFVIGPIGGVFTLTYGGGQTTGGTIGAGGVVWFSFEIGPETEPEPEVLSLSGVELNRNRLTISWQTDKGGSYQVQRSTDLQSWTDVGSLRTGNGNRLSHTQALSALRGFLRVIIP
tara:strand:- start:1489 stop:2148 length:660 start_codon:yes stop_codon:yes gene_type:complete